MKIVLAFLACTVGCGFQSRATGDVDASVPDAAPVDAPELDAFEPPIDAPPDAPEMGRTRAGLIGLWEFDEATNPLALTTADTSGVEPPVTLNATFNTMTIGSGAMSPNGIAVITSPPRPRLDQQAMTARAVTLEAWVKPSLAEQGSLEQPAVVAGLNGTIKTRNISLMQAGTKWLARVRTTADQNGGPDLLSDVDVAADTMTHLMVIADSTQRVLYVNGVLAASTMPPGPPLAWDQAYAMTLGNEGSGNRQWTGTFALVAIYARALGTEQVTNHYNAGPDAK